MKSRVGKIVVLGSLNIDFIAAVKSLPQPGETVAATRLVQHFGGKGANQAIAAARQGAKVAIIGAVGSDAVAKEYVGHLRREKILTEGVLKISSALTGTALIAVDQQGENMIVVSPGANGALSPKKVRAGEKQFRQACVLLTQFEVPFDCVLEGMELADRDGAKIILNPSPYRAGFPWGKVSIDTLITNELEANAIFGMKAQSMKNSLTRWRAAIKRKAVQRLIVTRGSRPTLCLEEEVFFHAPAFCVQPVDTVGAGDAFAGTFAARRARGSDVRKAVRFANAAGALATLSRGAQEAMPTERATEKFLRKSER